jgi:hypothetical protein
VGFASLSSTLRAKTNRRTQIDGIAICCAQLQRRYGAHLDQKLLAHQPVDHQ